VAEQFLIGIGVHVTLANNGLEAVEHAARERFDLVLMDMHMPVMDGVTAAKQIFGVPIVAMTAAVSNEDRMLCQSAGMVGFVAKPVDPDELVNLLRRWLPMSTSPANATTTSQVDTTPPFVFADFDGVAALRRLHGDKTQLMRLLGSFAVTHRDAGARLQAMLDAGDISAARDTLHALKGTSATLGLMAISRHAATLERSLKEGIAHPSTEVLKEAIHAAATAIEAHGETRREPAQSFLTVDKDAASQLLRALRRYVHEQELIPDVLVDELKNMATMGAAGSRMQALLQHVLDFDNASATTDIERLLESLGTEP
jgi:CheY-like chemotaxis protein/HPt (histidine-containing phosphotransfer) domain-containing protein